MKHINLLVWLTQLGLSVAAPLGGFVLLALWLRSQFGWGRWVLAVGLILGLSGAVSGFRSSLKIMENMAKDRKETPPPTGFNDHD